MGSFGSVFFARNPAEGGSLGLSSQRPNLSMVTVGGTGTFRCRILLHGPAAAGSWLDRPGENDQPACSPRRTTAGSTLAILLAVIILAGDGCISPLIKHISPSANEPATSAPAGQEDTKAGRNPTVFDRRPQRLAVEFKVHRFSAPSGTFSQNDAEIWKIATGSLPDAAATFRLADNGFRAAVGRESDRAALRGWLDELQGIRSALDTATPDAARSVEVEIGPCMPRQTVFYYDRRGMLHGLDFVNAKARFKLAFEMRSPNLHEVWLEVVPELEEPPGPPKWVITPQGAKQEPEERRNTFGELAFSAEIPEGGFLLLGPTPTVRQRPLLANPFFLEEPENTDTAGGGPSAPETRESIYIISPIIRSQTPGQPPG